MATRRRREYTMTLTQKGQVTIPVEIRRLLQLKPKKKVTFEVEGGQVKLRAASATLEAAYGAVKPISRPEDFERLAEIAREDQAAEAQRDLQ